MSEQKHTPLPWVRKPLSGKLEVWAYADTLYATINNKLVKLCTFHGTREQGSGNARFAEFACNSHADLLAVAERTKNMMQTLIEDLGGIAGGPVLSGLRKLRDEAEAAIAKVPS